MSGQPTEQPLDAPIPRVSDADRDRAALTIASHASDADDARMLLAMVGLIEVAPGEYARPDDELERCARGHAMNRANTYRGSDGLARSRCRACNREGWGT